MTLRLNGSTSGYVELDAPAVAGNNTLILPSGGSLVAATNGNIDITSINSGPLSGFRNRIINSRMRYDQRNGGNALTLNSANAGGTGFVADRFRSGGIGGTWGTGVISSRAVQIFNTAGANYEANSSPSRAISSNALKLTVTTAHASPSSTTGYGLVQGIEAGNIHDFGWGTADAKPATLSFWVKSSITGTHCVAVRNGDSTRSYVITYNIAAANTWQYVSAVISGDTGGTWNDPSLDAGLYLNWDLGSGTNNNAAAANTWSNGSFSRVAGAVSFISTLNATLYITAVQLELGSIATPCEPISLQQELALCQRYYHTSSASDRIVVNANSYSHVFFPVTMRAVPTLVLTCGGTQSDIQVASRSFYFNNTTLSGYSFTASAEL